MEFTPNSPPCVTIRIEYEAAPIVYCDALNEREAQMLAAWVESHDSYRALVARAQALAEAA